MTALWWWKTLMATKRSTASGTTSNCNLLWPSEINHHICSTFTMIWYVVFGSKNVLCILWALGMQRTIRPRHGQSVMVYEDEWWPTGPTFHLWLFLNQLMTWAINAWWCCLKGYVFWPNLIYWLLLFYWFH